MQPAAQQDSTTGITLLMIQILRHLIGSILVSMIARAARAKISV